MRHNVSMCRESQSIPLHSTPGHGDDQNIWPYSYESQAFLVIKRSRPHSFWAPESGCEYYAQNFGIKVLCR